MFIVTITLLIVSCIIPMFAVDDKTLQAEAAVAVIVLTMVLCREIGEIREYRRRADAFAQWTIAMSQHFHWENASLIQDAKIQNLDITTATVHHHLAEKDMP